MDKERIMEKINGIPTLPGVYKMLDEQGRVIYIGKSISLKKRVKSYFTTKHDWIKIEKMVSLIHDIEYIVTDTHLEARLLECELIKKMKPMFNSQFKNDEKYVYLKIEDHNHYNPLSVVYNREENSFGPFRKKYFLMDLANSLKNLYPIVRDDEGYTFEYNLIPINMDKDVYENNKQSLLNIFSNEEEMALFIAELEKKMYDSSSKLEFSLAGFYRDLISDLNFVKKEIHDYKSILSKDILLKIPIDKGYKLFFVSNGEIYLKATYTSLIKGDMERFIDFGRALKSSSPYKLNEKPSLDFRDIIYSEIKSLPDDMVEYLK
ncbi:MAG TPA: GIY-YIG nuclease family protein [Tissierellaceae bacterium]